MFQKKSWFASMKFKIALENAKRNSSTQPLDPGSSLRCGQDDEERCYRATLQFEVDTISERSLEIKVY